MPGAVGKQENGPEISRRHPDGDRGSRQARPRPARDQKPARGAGSRRPTLAATAPRSLATSPRSAHARLESGRLVLLVETAQPATIAAITAQRLRDLTN